MQYVPGAGALIYIHCPIVAVPADFPEVFSALRTYVLSQSKLLGLLVFTLSLGPVAANLVSTSQRIEPVDEDNMIPLRRCTTAMTSQARTFRHSDVSRK